MNELERPESRREGEVLARGKKGLLTIRWYDADGRQHRESTKSRDPRVADRMLRMRLGAKERGERHLTHTRRVTVGDLLDGLRDHHERQGTKSWPRIREHSDWIAEHFGRDERVSRVDYAALEEYAKARRRTAAAATVRNELATFKQAFKLAAMRGHVAAVPVFPSVKVRNVRTVTFTDDELAALLAALPAPIAAVTEFSSLTGWRLAECVNLRWDRVDFDSRRIRLEAGESKSRKPRVVPFGPRPRLADLLERQRAERWRVERERGVAVDTVFHRDGRPFTGSSLHHVWLAACRRAGLEGRHFHDLRRYACSSMIAAGVASTEAMALMGHATLSMHLRYGITSMDMLEAAVAKVAARER